MYKCLRMQVPRPWRTTPLHLTFAWEYVLASKMVLWCVHDAVITHCFIGGTGACYKCVAVNANCVQLQRPASVGHVTSFFVPLHNLLEQG